MPDRYADAVRARRRELRAHRERLDGTHRAELRTALALSRVITTAETATALAELGREVGEHLDRADGSGRRATPSLLTAALDAEVRAGHRAWAAELRPALRRIATERGLPVPPGWPRLPPPSPPPTPAPPAPVPLRRTLRRGVVQGMALWRLLVLPLVVLPVGLPVLGGPAFAPLGAGIGVAALVVAVRSGCASVDRARLLRHADRVLAAAAVGLDADLARRLLELERSAGPALDAAVSRRRREVDAEQNALAAGAVDG
jgi:hypothetical protein